MNGLSVGWQIGLLVLLFAGGYGARRAGVLGPAHAGRMLQWVLNAGLPALFIANISRIPLTGELLALPASAILIMLLTWGATLLVGGRLHLPRLDQGALTLCSISINNSFLFAFVLAAWGGEAFAQLALFDFGHALMQSSLVYAIAAAYGGHGAGASTILRKVLAFPLLWALAAAIGLNVADIALPEALVTTLGYVGRAILLLVVVALGVLFDARLLRSRAVIAALLMRVPLGLALGYALAELFGLEGMTRAVLLLGSAAPIGFNAVVLASREGLNRDLAASAASISVLLGFVYVPLALWLLRP